MTVSQAKFNITPVILSILGRYLCTKHFKLGQRQLMIMILSLVRWAVSRTTQIRRACLTNVWGKPLSYQLIFSIGIGLLINNINYETIMKN